MSQMLKKQLIKTSPILLPLVNAALWGGALILHKFFNILNSFVEAMPFIILQIVISWLCGVFIKKLNYGANNDDLTGLYNRRYLNTRLEEEIERLKRTKGSLSLILIDVDSFKQVNDTYGHLVGDKVLAKLGEILKHSTRRVDIVARWGGEEFAIIMPETDLSGAKTFADRLRRNVENFDFGFQVTISLGVVSDFKGSSFDEILTRADEALYRAKENRNRVVIYGRPDLV